MEINEFNFLLTKEILINFCMPDLALSECQACDNRTPKRSVTKNKDCDNDMPQLNMA